MWTYQAPMADRLFVMDPVLGAPASWAEMPHFDGLDAGTAREVVEQVARFAGQVLAPTHAPGDLAGCIWSPEGVATPPGYRAAYQAFVAGGWPALACAPEAGGQGLPQLLNAALFEMLAAANHGWTMYPGLLHGAYEVLKAHAVPALRELYLSKLSSGEWLGTMCLTEPQAGSDLGLVRTRANLVGQGAAAANGAPVLISGSKNFISGGDHDLTDNIVHLVLCRISGQASADAPAGTRGLSLAVVPKILPVGRGNAVHRDGIEKKMGIKGSATCQMRFEGAEGWLIGEPHRGLAAMFLMMNAARLHVGLQGLGHREVSTQNTWRYAAERLQIRAAQRPAGAPPVSAHDGGARSDALMQVLAREVHACQALPALQPFATALALQSAQFGLDWLLPQAQVHWGRAGRADAALPFLTV